MTGSNINCDRLTELTHELHLLLHEAAPVPGRTTAMARITEVDRVLRESIGLRNDGGYCAELLEACPQCHSEVQRLAAGQQHLIAELDSLRPLAERITEDNPATVTAFAAMWSRWVSHLTAHEYLEGRLLQNAYGSDTGGEA